MSTNNEKISISGYTGLILIFINAAILKHAFTVNEQWYNVLFVTLPILLLFIMHKKNIFLLFINKKKRVL